ncbi:unnamed protein product, partial [Polarella glacialis]
QSPRKSSGSVRAASSCPWPRRSPRSCVGFQRAVRQPWKQSSAERRRTTGRAPTAWQTVWPRSIAGRWPPRSRAARCGPSAASPSSWSSLRTRKRRRTAK